MSVMIPSRNFASLKSTNHDENVFSDQPNTSTGTWCMKSNDGNKCNNCAWNDKIKYIIE